MPPLAPDVLSDLNLTPLARSPCCDILLAAHYIILPMCVTAVVNSKVIAVLFTFVPLFGLWNLNFISIELENPFGVDDNDLPMIHFQTEMNAGQRRLKLHARTD